MTRKQKRIPLPDSKWLAEQYLLPPEGKGRSCPDIGRELGVTKYVVQRWVKKLGLHQDKRERRVFMRKGNPTWWLEPPARDLLAQKYLLPPDGQGMTLEELAKDLGVSIPTIRRWLKVYQLTQEFTERHSQRMTGDGNPAYVNGDSGRYVGRKLAKKKPRVCDWCGTTDRVQVHHIDHNHDNNDESNLTWLCGYCNILEAQLWALTNAGRAKVSLEDNKLIVTFVGKTT